MCSHVNVAHMRENADGNAYGCVSNQHISAIQKGKLFIFLSQPEGIFPIYSSPLSLQSRHRFNDANDTHLSRPLISCAGDDAGFFVQMAIIVQFCSRMMNQRSA